MAVLGGRFLFAGIIEQFKYWRFCESGRSCSRFVFCWRLFFICVNCALDGV